MSPQDLTSIFRLHGTTHPVKASAESVYGVRYTIEGEMETPDGRRPLVRTVWMFEKNAAGPRLVTAYPMREV